MQPSSRRLLLVGLLLLSSFTWGWAANRYRIFPSRLAQQISDSAGRGSAESPRSGEETKGDKRPGLWHIARSTAQTGGTPDREAIEKLADLPYMSGYEVAPREQQVTVFDREAAWPGVNLVVSGHAPEVYLIDMEGRVLHRWRRELADVWPEMARQQELGGFETFFRRAHLLPNGDLLAIYDGLGLIKLDRDSNLIWGHAGGEHHDLFVDETGRIHTLTRRLRQEYERFEIEAPIEEDFVTVLGPDGTVEKEFSVLDSFLDSSYAPLLELARRQGDLLHTNTIEIMDGRFADRHPMFTAGNILISVPRLNTIAVIDPRTERVIWALSGLWRFQHQPTVVDDARILVFDNTGNGGDSSVIEIDPLTQTIAWAYRGSPERRFTSYFLGSSQRLPNGNTLITESTAGRAFEVDGSGEMVWEYVNPHRAGDAGELIASLLEVVRLSSDEMTPEFAALLNVSGREAPTDAR